MTTILSIDPAGMGTGETGIALGYYSDTEPYRLVETWAVPDNLDGFRVWFKKYTRMHGSALILGDDVARVDVVICEQWVDRNIRGADRSPLLIEGAVRFLWPSVVLQPASGKNTAVSDAVLKKLGVYTEGGHHRDITEATRHAVWYCKKIKHVPTLRAGWSS